MNDARQHLPKTMNKLLVYSEGKENSHDYLVEGCSLLTALQNYLPFKINAKYC